MGKIHPRDRTVWLGREDSNLPMAEVVLDVRGAVGRRAQIHQGALQPAPYARSVATVDITELAPPSRRAAERKIFLRSPAVEGV
jgi:hypothetical protein